MSRSKTIRLLFRNQTQLRPFIKFLSCGRLDKSHRLSNFVHIRDRRCSFLSLELLFNDLFVLFLPDLTLASFE